MKKVKFAPAYSGGRMKPEGVRIPESVTVNGEVYPAGTDFPAVVNLKTVKLTANVPILFGHDPSIRLGHTEKVETDGKAIFAEGILESPGQWKEEIVQSLEAGARWQASIGSGLIGPEQKTIVYAEESLFVNGRSIPGPFILLDGIEVKEISIVPAGADPGADVLLASAFLSKRDMKMSFDEFALSKGFDLGALDEKNLAALKALLTQLESDETDDEDETLTAEGIEEKDETLTAEGIEEKDETLTAEGTEEKDETLTAEGAQQEDEKVELRSSKEKLTASGRIRAGKIFPSLNSPRFTSRPSAGTEPLKKSEILQCSALLNLGVPADWLVKDGYTRRTVDAAEKAKSEGSMLSLMGETLKAAGIKADYRNPRRIVEDFKDQLRAAGVSTKTFGDVNVFSPIIDKQMRYKYERLESIWTKLYRKRTVRDFNEVATVDFDTIGRAKDLIENEDFPAVELKSTGAKFAVTKQGITAGISFESQVNDDLGALDLVADELVFMIADAQTDKFWKLFWNLNSQIFTASNGNKITDKLSIKGLSAAKKAFGSRKNANGRFLNTPPKYLLVPLSLEDEALNLFQWKWGENMSGNIHAGKYEVLTDPYLGTEGGYPGASDTGWFMVGDTARYPLGEFAVMSGYETPRIKETWYDHKDALNLRAMGTIGFYGYQERIPAVYSDGSKAN